MDNIEDLLARQKVAILLAQFRGYLLAGGFTTDQSFELSRDFFNELLDRSAEE